MPVAGMIGGLCLALVFAFAGSRGQAADIIWFSQVQSDSGKEFPALLRGQGYTVEERVLTSATLDETALAELNASRLVIFSRKAASGNYNTAAWDDAITAPMIVMSPFMTRSSIWAWFDNTGLVDQNPATMQIAEPEHALFKEVTVTDGISGPWYLTPTVGLGTSFSTNAVIHGGTLLASTPTGAVAAAQWPARATPDAEEGVAAGPRLLLCMGARELSGAAIDTAGKYNLNATGERIFLNAVALYAPPPTKDSDGDGVVDAADAFPQNPLESVDSDGDGIGNNADPDDDNDGVPDATDAFPLDPTESADTDGDGIGNNTDPDNDNDWVPDLDDAFPANSAEWDDTDKDGTGDNADPDADGDGLADPRVSKIVWVSQVENTSGQEFLDLLTAAGHTVIRYVGDSAALTADPAKVARVMHTADLVIFSRQTTSDAYNTAVWDQIKTPMIVMTPYILRASRWGWFAGEALPVATPVNMLAETGHAGDALFAGVEMDGSGLMPGWHTAVGRGTTFSGETGVSSGGTVLARTDGGALAAARWPAATVAAGPRLFLAMGSWEPTGTTIADAGAWNLTETGSRILLNAAALYTQPVVVAPDSFRITSFERHPANGAVTLTWESAAGRKFTVQRSRDLSSWLSIATDLPGTDGLTSFTDNSPPGTPGPVFYRIQRQSP